MQNTKNIPKLRFKDTNGKAFPEWEEKKLGDISEVIMGQSPPSSSYNNQGKGAYLVQGNADILNRASNPRNWTTKPTKITSVGDLLLTVRAPVGTIAISKHNACIGRGICAIRNKNNSDIKFLYQFLLNFENKWIKYEQGSTFKAISTVDIKKLAVKVPTLNEQQKIAEFLGVVDRWIENLQEQKQALETYKKGLMQKIFSQKIRFKPVPRSLGEVGDANGKAFPEWEEVKLYEVFKKKTAKNRDNKISLVLTNSAVQGIVSQIKYFEKDIANQNNLSNYYIVDIDDFVYNPRISKHAPVGPLNRNSLAQGVMSPLYSVIKLKGGNKIFYEKYFETSLWHRYMKQVANYGARHDRMAISNDDLMNLPLPFPDLDEQKKIADFLTSLDNLIESKQQKISKAEQWKKGLMQKMFV